MINIIAPINQLGYGVTGLNITKELFKIDNSTSLFVMGQPSLSTQEEANIIRSCVGNGITPNWDNPCLRIWHQHDMSMFVGNGQKIGFPIFELENFDDVEKYHLSSLDKIFVCSQWAKNVILKNIAFNENDVHVIPLGVDTELFKPCTEQREDNDTTRFFNCGKWEIRKGHDILHELFNAAFNKDDNVELWMMCQNPFLSPEEHQEWVNLYKDTELGDKIKFLGRVGSHGEVYNIMKEVDCGIFPARTEGWNLEALELMACGKHVITSNCSGHTEFCNNDNSFLVTPSEEDVAYDGKWFHGDKGNWPSFSEDDKEKFINHMREIHSMKKQNGNQSLFNFSGVETANNFTWENSAKKIVEIINA